VWVQDGGSSHECSFGWKRHAVAVVSCCAFSTASTNPQGAKLASSGDLYVMCILHGIIADGVAFLLCSQAAAVADIVVLDVLAVSCHTPDRVIMPLMLLMA
jgi:hypothetical protein